MWFGASDLLSFIQDKYSPLKHVEVGVNTFTRAMNNVKSFGGPENMRQYEEGNAHGPQWGGIWCLTFLPWLRPNLSPFLRCLSTHEFLQK